MATKILTRAKKTAPMKPFTTMNVSVPAPQKEWVSERVRQGGFGTVSAYVNDLIRRDRLESEREAFERELLQRLKAPGRAISTADVEGMKQHLLARSRRRRRS